VEIVQSQTQNVADRSVGRDSADAGLPFGGQLAATVPLQSPRSVFAAAASVDQNASSGFDKQDFFSTVAQNIHQSIQFCLQRNEQQVTINLYPPELGRVRVRIRQEDQQITGLLEVEKLQTKNEIQQSLPEILRTLQDWQVSVKRMEVVLSENSSSQGGCARDQSLVDYGYPGEQTFGGTQVADHPAGQAAAWQFDGGEEQEQLSIMGADVVDCLNLWV
jgi:flagellar hook-length control protein FliK